MQLVRYSSDYAYINSSGTPAYIVGPYLDGNLALATNMNWLFKLPLEPEQNIGTLTSPPMGVIGVFINGVPMYDYRDGASYSASSGKDEMQNGDGAWNRNAIMAEQAGFDCAKGIPPPRWRTRVACVLFRQVTGHQAPTIDFQSFILAAVAQAFFHFNVVLLPYKYIQPINRGKAYEVQSSLS